MSAVLGTRLESLALLGLDRDADDDEIRKAYRTACLRWHPDRPANRGNVDQATRRFKEVQAAFKVISSNDEALAAAAVDAAAAFTSKIEPDTQRPQTLWRQEGNSLLRIGDVLFIGQVLSGQPHGSGDMIFRDGSVHHGMFVTGRADGLGVLYSANGAIFKGLFEKNRRIGTFEVVDPKGTRWIDEYDNEGKRMRRTTLAAVKAAETAARAAEAAAALAQAKVSEVDASLPPEAKRSPTAPLGLTAAARAECAAHYAEANRQEALRGKNGAVAEDAARYERMSKEDRQAANEARRLAGAAIRAEARRAEGGGFAGFTPPASPLPSRQGATESQHDVSLFAGEVDEYVGGAAVQCRHCTAKFHPWRAACCRQHNSLWMEIPDPIDWDEFPQGGMYLCCGALDKQGAGCSIGKHEVCT